jgi:Zn-dependent protease with chaperone function
MYELLGISLVLATLLTINAVASLAAAGCWRVLASHARHWSSRTRAEILFAMRAGPPVIAGLAVAAFLIPSFLIYEPYSTNEVVGKKLGALAVVSAVGVLLALWRGFRSLLATHSLLKKWLSAAVPVELSGISIPTFRIPHSFPIIAVVGTMRPRLFIADRVLASLSQGELIAAIAHECGHLAARDNFKRSLLRACRDALLIIPCGRSLDRSWAEASESAADEYAAQESPTLALNLASALVRIARMIPAGARPAMPVAAFLVGGEETRGVKGRVRRLLEMASADGRSQIPPRSRAGLVPLISVSLLFLLVITVGTNPQVLASVHSLIERVVDLLA